LLLLFCIPFLLISSECKKHQSNPYSDNGLPPATHTGENIFACRVNGEVWIAKKGLSISESSLHADTFGVSGFNQRLVGIVLCDYSSDKNQYRLNDTISSYGIYQ